jgi:copper transport protein
VRLRGRVATLAAMAGFWLLASGPAAAAHGLLRSSDPAGGASLERAPAAVTLRFSEPPDPGLSTVRVLDTGGRVVAGGAARPVPGRPSELRVPTAGLPAGGYTVSWRIVSAVDGHGTDGVFAFGVGGAGASELPPAQVVAEVRSTAAPSPVAVAGRWAFYWGLTLLVGAAATGLLVFGRRLPGRPSLLLGLALLATAAGLVAMAAAARAGAGVSLGELLGSTTGRWLLWRAVMLAGAGAATWWLLARPGRAGPLVAVGVAAGGGMAVHALAGHAAAASSLRPVNLLAQWVHLLAVGAWIGGLAWLLTGLRPRTEDAPQPTGSGTEDAPQPTGSGTEDAVQPTGSRLRPPVGERSEPSAEVPAVVHRRIEREVVVRFSRLAGISLGVVVVTGLARTLDELDGWRRLADSGFGRALDLKLLLFAGLLALGALNRYRLLPLLGAGPRRRAVQRLRRSVRGELWLGGAVLAAAALLSQLAPGAPAVGSSMGPPAAPLLRATGTDWTTTVRVTLTVTPGAAGPNRFAVTVADFDTGATLPADRVELSGLPLSRPDLAMASLELVEGADGRWLGKGRLLSMAGAWRLQTTVQSAAGGVTVPLELTVPPAAPT